MGGLVKITRPFTDGMKNATTLSTHLVASYAWVDRWWEAEVGTGVIVADHTRTRSVKRTGSPEVVVDGTADRPLRLRLDGVAAGVVGVDSNVVVA